MKIYAHEMLYKGHIIIRLSDGYLVDAVHADALNEPHRISVLSDDAQPKMFASKASAMRYIGSAKIDQK